MSQPVNALASELGRRWPQVVPLWATALAAVTLAWLVFSYGYFEDDAFIHLEFARSVAAGAGFSFNGMLVNGDTAPAWVLVLTALHTLGIGWIECGKVACFLGVALTIAAIWRVANDLPGNPAHKERLGVAAIAVTVVNPFFVHWSFSGMESIAALGVSLWIIWAVFVRRASHIALTCGAALLGLSPLLRPELLLLAAIVGPVILWRCWQLARSESPAKRCARVAALAAIMVLPLVAWSGYALHAFGSLMPSTNLAKRGGSLRELAPRLAIVYLTGFPVTLACLPLIGFFRIRGTRLPASILLLLAWPLLCIAFYLANRTVVQTRYCLLSMPCMSIAVLWIVSSYYRRAAWRAVTGLMIAASLATIWLAVLPHVANKKRVVATFAALSSFLREGIPADDPVALFAIGEIAFQSRHPLVDIGGITRPGAIAFLNDPQGQLRWAKEQGARYLINGGQVPEPGAVEVFRAPVPFLGWTVHRSQYRTNQSIAVYRLADR